MTIAFLRRLLGLDHAELAQQPPLAPESSAPEPPPPEPVAPSVVACPNCGVVLDPPPTSTRLCPRCRRRIVVRHAEGRAIYLTEAAVEVFEAERRRSADEQAWTRQRRSWLQLARLVGAATYRRQRIASAPLSSASVEAARALYLTTADRAVRAARRGRHWEDVARLRQRQAAALYEDAGGNPPPAPDIVDLYHEGVAATLRGLSAVAREAELVGATCCAACRADNERIFKIVDELRTPRLPHAGCPRGLCACDWWPAVRKPPRKRSRRSTPTVVTSPESVDASEQ
ncbi:MAG: hypothetical protein ACRDGQ_00525 [Candidatus Limnocylindrales bacterium]